MTDRDPRHLADARGHLWGVVATDPARAESTAEVFGALSGNAAPDRATIAPVLDGQQRVILRITPTKFFFEE